jgi:hypothetical protein
LETLWFKFEVITFQLGVQVQVQVLVQVLASP